MKKQFNIGIDKIYILNHLATVSPLKFSLSDEFKDGKYTKVRVTILSRKVLKIRLETANKYITLAPSIQESKDRANVLYTLYSTYNLILLGHRFPSRNDWCEYYGAMTIDHKMPKSLYPELTFDVDNWEPRTKWENQAKGLSHAEEAAAYLKKEKVELNDAIEQLIGCL